MSELHDAIGGFRDVLLTLSDVPADAVCLNVGQPCPCGRGTIIDPHYAEVLGVERPNWMVCGSWTPEYRRNRPHPQPECYYLYCVDRVDPLPSGRSGGEIRVSIIWKRRDTSLDGEL